jgi:hypothetical protein
MEFYFAAFYSSLPFPLTEKVAKFPMENALSNVLSYTPENWFDLVRENDPNKQYIVTALSHYKEKSPWPDCQHEYLVLFIQLRPSPHQSAAPDSFQIKVSRTITGHALPARLGLWGPAADIVEVRGFAPAAIQDQQLHLLTWAPDDAPSLLTISFLIQQIHSEIPQYRLLQTSCSAFARVVGRVIFQLFDGTAGAEHPLPFLIRESYLLRCIPSGITRAESVAVNVANTYRDYHRNREGK